MTLRERYNLYIYIKPKLLKLSQFFTSSLFLKHQNFKTKILILITTSHYFSPILLLLPYKNPINSFSFPIFPSSPFICVYSSFASLAFPFFYCHWCPKPKEIKSLIFFFFSNKAVYQYGRHYPFPMKKLDM